VGNIPRVINGDAKDKLHTIADNSIDLLCTDHPYRYGFMGKAWDKIQDFTPIWTECFRVLKPGAFGFIMNAPRSDCQLLLLSELAAVGFNIKFSPILWCYNSGFPKAGDTSKLIDKRLGLEREVVGQYEHPGRKDRSYQTTSNVFSGDRAHDKIENHNSIYSQVNRIDTRIKDENGRLQLPITTPACPESARFEGSKVGHQLKPAYEVVTVVMKPLDQPTYIDQALSNGKGVTWIDDCRIPYAELSDAMSMFKGNPNVTPNKNVDVPFGQSDTCHIAYEEGNRLKQQKTEAFQKLKKKLVGGRLSQEKRWTYGDEQVDGFKAQAFEEVNINLKGRYPANLLVSDHVLDQGITLKTGDIKPYKQAGTGFMQGLNGKKSTTQEYTGFHKGDSGDVSRYYSLDAWWTQHIGEYIKTLPKAQQQTFPFLFVPKASKSEKNKGLSSFESKQKWNKGGEGTGISARESVMTKNIHPTSKPIQLMSYLITLGSRPGDLVLDPFAGSGTTGIACKLESRDYILIELMPEYYAIMKARLKATQVQQKLF